MATTQSAVAKLAAANPDVLVVPASVAVAPYHSPPPHPAAMLV
jgi:hypothetical protein